WKISTSATSGTVTMIVAAMIVPHGCWNEPPDSPTNDVIASGTVYLAGSWMNESANRYSFQAEMNASSPVVTRPGRISGSSTLRNVCIGVAPSTNAASSSSPGIERKKFVSTQMVKGSVNVR